MAINTLDLIQSLLLINYEPNSGHPFGSTVQIDSSSFLSARFYRICSGSESVRSSFLRPPQARGGDRIDGGIVLENKRRAQTPEALIGPVDYQSDKGEEILDSDSVWEG